MSKAVSEQCSEATGTRAWKLRVELVGQVAEAGVRLRCPSSKGVWRRGGL